MVFEKALPARKSTFLDIFGYQLSTGDPLFWRAQAAMRTVLFSITAENLECLLRKGEGINTEYK